jgi:hypothetical protein
MQGFYTLRGLKFNKFRLQMGKLPDEKPGAVTLRITNKRDIRLI